MGTVSPIAQTVVYPLITAIGSQADNREWLHLCTKDVAALHLTAFSVEGFIDLFLHRRMIGPAAMVHFHKGVTILRERLSSDDEEAKTTDATIGVVLKLAIAAHFSGEHQAAKQHMEGIRKMVDCRGGLGTFKGSELSSEMLRYLASVL